MQETIGRRQAISAPDGEKLFEVLWAETDQYYVLVWASNEKEARLKWLDKYKEHWCAELISRELSAGPVVKEAVE